MRLHLIGTGSHTQSDRPRAVVNDSVATLLSHMHTDRRCKIGVIVGTGVNASVKVPISCIDEEKLSRCNPGLCRMYFEYGVIDVWGGYLAAYGRRRRRHRGCRHGVRDGKVFRV
ncbi:hypothetical protein V1507DRAFT_456794 [Lipomyces tetrasporus]